MRKLFTLFVTSLLCTSICFGQTAPYLGTTSSVDTNKSSILDGAQIIVSKRVQGRLSSIKLPSSLPKEEDVSPLIREQFVWQSKTQIGSPIEPPSSHQYAGELLNEKKSDSFVPFVSPLFERRDIDTEERLARLIVSKGATELGRIAESQSVVVMLNNEGFRSLLREIAPKIGLKDTGFLIKTIGAGIGVATAGAIVSYSLYFLGYSTLEEAHRGLVASAAGGTAYFITSSSLMGFATTFGTASTGTAISTLSGAAATNSGLAWLGGGAISSGGGGMAAGTMVLATTSLVVVFVVAGGVMLAFKFHDQGQEADRIRLTSDWLAEKYKS